MNVAICSQDHTRRALRHSNAFPLFLVFLMFTAFGSQPQTAAAQDATGRFNIIRAAIVDVGGNTPTDPSTPLYKKNTDPPFPVLAPDGHHVTLEEFLKADGEGTITRTPQGTELRMELTGLIANGVYSGWGFHFTDPPFNFDEFPNFGASANKGATGVNDGSTGRFDADDNGDATYVVMLPPGPLSQAGEAPAYALDGFSSFAVGGVYHIDGETHGPVPAPNHIGAFSIGFVPEPSSIALVRHPR